MKETFCNKSLLKQGHKVMARKPGGHSAFLMAQSQKLGRGERGGGRWGMLAV